MSTEDMTPESIDAAMKHEGWSAFVRVCEQEGVPLDNSEDWYPWWEFFLNGWESSVQFIAHGELL